MSVARTVLLKVSDNQWLRENGTRLPFIRRAVSRFMPGESFEEMIAAARATAADGIASVFTRLGENVKDLGEADAVARHYLEGIDRLRALNLDCEPSIKLTQLGLDIDRELAYAHLRDLAARAHAANNYLWVDMEQSLVCRRHAGVDQAPARGVSRAWAYACRRTCFARARTSKTSPRGALACGW